MCCLKAAESIRGGYYHRAAAPDPIYTSVSRKAGRSLPLLPLLPTPRALGPVVLWIVCIECARSRSHADNAPDEGIRHYFAVTIFATIFAMLLTRVAKR